MAGSVREEFKRELSGPGVPILFGLLLLVIWIAAAESDGSAVFGALVIPTALVLLIGRSKLPDYIRWLPRVFCAVAAAWLLWQLMIVQGGFGWLAAAGVDVWDFLESLTRIEWIAIIGFWLIFRGLRRISRQIEAAVRGEPPPKPYTWL